MQVYRCTTSAKCTDGSIDQICSSSFKEQAIPSRGGNEEISSRRWNDGLRTEMPNALELIWIPVTVNTFSPGRFADLRWKRSLALNAMCLFKQIQFCMFWVCFLFFLLQLHILPHLNQPPNNQNCMIISPRVIGNKVIGSTDGKF